MRHALITFGNEESYGLSFVGGALQEFGQDIRFFESSGNWLDVKRWKPDYIMFSPLTTFWPKAVDLAEKLKFSTKAKVVFGGHHAMSDPTIIKNHCIDSVVVGPVNGSVERILNGETGIIKTAPTDPKHLTQPAREKHYEDIPRAGKRYRKFLLSMLGCPWNCSYCSSSSGHISEIFSPRVLRDYYLKRRPVSDVISEAKGIMKNTREIEWVDDDIFCGDEEWLLEFAGEWEKNFYSITVDPYGPDQKNVIPMYVSTTSVNALKASDRILKRLSSIVSAVGMGIQAIRPESLKLCNRSWDNEIKMKAAYDRLTSFGYRVNLQFIVGFPVDDPVEDAIQTLLAVKRIGPGSICSCYPLMVYPGTKMAEYCKDLNPECNGDTNSAVCGIKFSAKEERRLKNICKLATFFVKYNIDERWIRALINVDLEDVSEELSRLRYHECVTDRLGDKVCFSDILKTMELRF
jgi:radical SAM superfamily enzyme YgiQ (UPF0313 family)